MSQSYEEYLQEYNQCLSKVRSFLSSNAKSKTTLRECNRLLSQAKRCASAMVTLCQEDETSNGFRLAEAQRREEREIVPLVQEVERALRERERLDSGMMMSFDVGGNSSSNQEQKNRAELFSGRGSGGYRPPSIENNNPNDYGEEDSNHDHDVEMNSLIQESQNLLLESQTYAAESEQIGSNTLHRMGMQREQLFSTNETLRGAMNYVEQAGVIVKDMSRKSYRNKRFLYGVIVVLVLANVAVLVAIVKKRSK